MRKSTHYTVSERIERIEARLKSERPEDFYAKEFDEFGETERGVHDNWPNQWMDDVVNNSL